VVWGRGRGVVKMGCFFGGAPFTPWHSGTRVSWRAQRGALWEGPPIYFWSREKKSPRQWTKRVIAGEEKKGRGGGFEGEERGVWPGNAFLTESLLLTFMEKRKRKRESWNVV